MEEIEKVISDITELFENAKIKDPISQLHTLIAYLRTSNNKTEADYAVNGIVSVFINNILRNIKENEIKVDKNEISIFCKALMFSSEASEEIMDVEIPRNSGKKYVDEPSEQLQELDNKSN